MYLCGSGNDQSQFKGLRKFHGGHRASTYLEEWLRYHLGSNRRWAASMNKWDSEEVQTEKKVVLGVNENKAVKVAELRLQKDFNARPSNLACRWKS